MNDDLHARAAKYGTDSHRRGPLIRELAAALRATEAELATARETVKDRDATIEGLHSYCEKADVLVDQLRADLADTQFALRNVAENLHSAGVISATARDDILRAASTASAPTTTEPCARCGKTWINGTCDDTVSRRARCAVVSATEDE